MANSSTLSSSLATLGASGWSIATPGNRVASVGQEPTVETGGVWTREQIVFAMERNRGLANAYGVMLPECNAAVLNVHSSAALGTATAGTAGATEILASAATCLVFGVLFAGDCAAGSILLYDKSALAGGAAVPAEVVTFNAAQLFVPLYGRIFTNGCTAIGTAAGVAGTILYRPR